MGANDQDEGKWGVAHLH